MSIGATTPEGVAKQLNDIAGELVSPALTRKFIKEARLQIIDQTRDSFDHCVDPDGIPWSPLKHARPNSKGRDKPLQNFGLLRASMTNTGKNHVEVMTDRSLVIGTNLARARIHQEGGTIKPVKAKALAIPLTKEAVGVKPMDFRRHLTLLWRPGAPSGILAEVPTKRATKREKAKSKQIRQYTPRMRSIIAKIKKLRKQVNSRNERVITRKIELQYSKLKALNRKTGQHHRDRQAMREKRTGIKAVYALVKSVTIPARPFLGFGRKLKEDLVNLAARIFGATITGQDDRTGSGQ